MSSDMGAPAIDARIVIGAMIIKHKMKLDDRETIETIRENMYMQYFLGLSEYTYEDVFDRSLFTTLRYRLGADKFDAMTRQIILRSEKKGDVAEEDLDEPGNDNTNNKLDSSHILCDEPDKVRQRIFVLFFKRGFIITFFSARHFYLAPE